MTDEKQSRWEHLAAICPPAADEIEIAAELLAEYRRQGHVRRTCRAMLALPEGAIVAFYRALAAGRRAESPVRGEPDSGWMARTDFCFVNVRATGLGDGPGHFVHAAKLLPAIRAGAIHLAPFTDYDFEVIYAVRSVRSLSPNVVEAGLARLGFSGEDQLRAFVEAAHLLGKAVGYDLEPHLAQFAVPVLEHPELVRWLHVAPDRAGLAGGLDQDTMLQQPHQARIAAEVQAIVAAGLRAHGIDSLEARDGDDEQTAAARRAAYFAAIRRLIDGGYWPVPSQIWSGDGVPAFSGYNLTGDYPTFLYLDRDGRDQTAYAFHVLTPYKFHFGLRPNRRPDAAHPAELNPPAVDRMAHIFDRWRDEFGFDFVRYDSADHIFDSVVDGGPARPSSDRPTPEVLRRCIAASRAAGHAYVGNLAERMGNEIRAYASVGFDAILGTDMLERIDRAWAEKSFRLHDELAALNAHRAVPFSVLFCVDTHDTGNPFLWGSSLIQIAGLDGMRLRHFVSRFLGAGRARRPKYEVMGAQDLSYGLYEANVRDVNLTWVGDGVYNRHYHHLEDVYERFRPLLDEGKMVRRFAADSHAWWAIARGDEMLVAVVSLEVEGGHGAPLPALTLDLSRLVPADGTAQVVAHDFAGDGERSGPLAGSTLEVGGLDYLSFRLYHVTTAKGKPGLNTKAQRCRDAR